jgi:hypothetical protein
MKKWCTALGFYQEISTVQSVQEKLKQKKFTRIATIHHLHNDQVEINRYFPYSALVFPCLALFAAGFLTFLNYLSFINLSWPFFPILIAVLLATAGIYAFFHFTNLIHTKIIDRFKNRVMLDEILILVQVHQSDVREVLAILRQVSSGHPVTFLLRPALFEEGVMDIPSEPLTLEQLSEEAGKLASTLEYTREYKSLDQSI